MLRGASFVNRVKASVETGATRTNRKRSSDYLSTETIVSPRYLFVLSWIDKWIRYGDIRVETRRRKKSNDDRWTTGERHRSWDRRRSRPEMFKNIQEEGGRGHSDETTRIALKNRRSISCNEEWRGTIVYREAATFNRCSIKRYCCTGH